jgi:acetoin utilization deacetylase AcuC-like enzyme
MQLDAAAYGRMTAALGRIADKSAKGRIALVLEGGYDLAALEASLAESLAVLADRSRAPTDTPAPERVHEGEIQRTAKALRDHWHGLS